MQIKVANEMLFLVHAARCASMHHGTCGDHGNRTAIPSYGLSAVREMPLQLCRTDNKRPSAHTDVMRTICAGSAGAQTCRCQLLLYSTAPKQPALRSTFIKATANAACGFGS